MSKFLNICLKAILLIAVSFVSYSQDTLKVFHTGELVILPSDEQLAKSSSINEITISKSETSRFLTADNAMQYARGILFQKNSRNEAFIKLRGYDQRQIGIFFDGVPLSNPYDGALDLSIFSLNNISKVSISKNMPSMYYGANSPAGTINLISDNIFNSSSVDATAQASHLSQSYSVNGALRNSDFYFSLGANYIRNSDFNYAKSESYEKIADDRMKNSSSDVFNTFAKVAYIASNNSIYSLSYLLGRSNKNIPANLLSNRKRFWQMPEIERDLLNLTHFNKFTDKLVLRGNLYYDKSYNILKSFDDSTYTTQTARNSFTSTYDDYKFGGNLIVEFNSGLLDLTKFSVNYQRDYHSAQSNIGADWTKYETSLTSFAAEQNFSLGNFGAIGGASYDLMKPHFADGKDLRNDATSFNYHFGINYSFSNVRIFANYSKKSRFPTQKEFYSEISGAAVANPDLKTEIGSNLELGIFARIDNMAINASLFHNNVTNLIDIEFLPENKRRFQNFGKAVFSGVELFVDWQFSYFGTKFGYTFLNSENLSDNATTKIMTNRPKHNIQFIINYKFATDYFAGLSSNFYFEHYSTNTDTRQIYKLPDYMMLNLSLERSFKNFDIFANINNLLNHAYEFEWGFPQPGINYQLGIRLKL